MKTLKNTILLRIALYKALTADEEASKENIFVLNLQKANLSEKNSSEANLRFNSAAYEYVKKNV